MYESFRITAVHARTGKDILHLDFTEVPEGKALVLHPELDGPRLLELRVLGEPFEVEEEKAEEHFTPEQLHAYAKALDADLRSAPPPRPMAPLGRSVRAAWTSSRLTFIKRDIDNLGPRDCFAIMVRGGPVYVMSRSEFEEDFPNVTESRSYNEYGSYNYRDTPARAEKYARN